MVFFTGNIFIMDFSGHPFITIARYVLAFDVLSGNKFLVHPVGYIIGELFWRMLRELPYGRDRRVLNL
jgi:hypothetical protein